MGRPPFHPLRARPRRLVALALCAGLGACGTPWVAHDLGPPPGLPAAPAGRAAGEPARVPGPRVLCVVAHPDDEIAFAGTLYKTATHLGGRCDVAVVTNGEGGYRYATLGELHYRQRLTEEALGRSRLPAIRTRELLAGCRVLGVRTVFQLGQTDHRYTLDLAEVLGPGAEVWDVEGVTRNLTEIMRAGRYDFLLTHAPTADTHAHHRAATVLALRAAQRLPPEERPVSLCVRAGQAGEPAPRYAGLPALPVTRPAPVEPGDGPLVFDRTQAFGHDGRLDYRIVVNWAIAEHKSQGTMQLLTGSGEHEHYFLFAANPPAAAERARAWFDALARPQFAPGAVAPRSPTPAGAR